jgi:steroid delta-isomerase-like uncharacterized protein
MTSIWLLAFFLFTGLPARAMEPVAVLDAYIAGWNSHDPAQCASHFDPQIEFYDATVGTPVKGKQNVLQDVVQTFMGAVPDLKLERSAEVLVSGDRLAYRWTFSGTNTGAWSDGTPATNKPFTIQGLTLMHLKDGKIIYSGDYYDAYGFYKQLGLLE